MLDNIACLRLLPKLLVVGKEKLALIRIQHLDSFFDILARQCLLLNQMVNFDIAPKAVTTVDWRCRLAQASNSNEGD